MATRFTRVTVVGDGRQLDISLPAQVPLTQQMPAVLRLLSMPSGAAPVGWRLAAPEFGPMDPGRSLDDIGVLDGTLLYLAKPADAPPPPFVDDFETAVAELVANRAADFGVGSRRTVVGALATVVLVAALAVGLAAPAFVGVVAPMLVLISALMIGRLIPENLGALASLTAVPAACTLLLGLMAARPTLFGVVGDAPVSAIGSEVFGWNGLPLALTGVATIALALVGMVRRSPGLTSGGCAVAVISLAALLCNRLDVTAPRIAGLAVLVAVVLSGLAGQIALGRTGLVDLMVADERGQPVSRRSVTVAVERGLAIVGGIVWASAAVGAVACWVLIVAVPAAATPASWTAPAIGVLGGSIFALRSRMFTRTAHVGPMLAVGVLTVVALALRLPIWLSAGPAASIVTLLLLLLVGLMLVAAGLTDLPEVAGARLQRTLERLEVVAVLALLPGLVLLFRVIPMVTGWWG